MADEEFIFLWRQPKFDYIWVNISMFFTQFWNIVFCNHISPNVAASMLFKILSECWTISIYWVKNIMLKGNLKTEP